MTINEGQDLRKRGMYLVTNNDMSIVVGVFSKHADAKKSAAKTDKIWQPLERMKWTKEDTKKALEELALGLQCNIQYT